MAVQDKSKAAKRSSAGFSLIELLIIWALLAIIFSFAVVNINYFHRNTVLANTVDEVVALLVSAQSKAIAGEGGKAYKIQYSLGSLQMVDEDGTLVTWLAHDAAVEIEPLAQDIIFEKITGRSNGGTIVVKLKDGSLSKTVTVNDLGEIKVN